MVMSPLNHLSDEELVARFRDGDDQAFALIYERYWKPMLVISFRILEDENAAKDIVQEVFVSIYQKIAARDIGNLKAYLYQAAKLQCFMHLRSGKISSRHLERMEQILTTNEVAESLEVEELERHLQHQIELLPDKCRQVFYLSRFEMLTNKKIAERLNISQKTVENQITKALRVLKTSVEKIAVIVFSLFF
jgi:RNA polymerase sigma-70 factor (family 1)